MLSFPLTCRHHPLNPFICSSSQFRPLYLSSLPSHSPPDYSFISYIIHLFIFTICLCSISCVEIAHIAKLINLSPVLVERKLSQMILDHRFSGMITHTYTYTCIYTHMHTHTHEHTHAYLDTRTHIFVH